MTLIDWGLVTLALGAVWSAGQRGLGRELLHLVLYGLTYAAGLWFMAGFPAPTTAEATANVLVDFGYYVIVAYLFTWIIGKYAAAALFDDDYPSTLSRFLAAVAALGGLMATILGLNLWLAMHCPDAHPLRMKVLPQLAQQSAIIQASDAETDDLYQWLAAKGLIEYRKYTYRKDDKQQAQSFEELLRDAEGPKPR